MGETKHSRSGKKAREAASKLGLRQVTGVSRVAVCKTKNLLTVISKQDVYKSRTPETYVQ